MKRSWIKIKLFSLNVSSYFCMYLANPRVIYLFIYLNATGFSHESFHNFSSHKSQFTFVQILRKKCAKLKYFPSLHCMFWNTNVKRKSCIPQKSYSMLNMTMFQIFTFNFGYYYLFYFFQHVIVPYPSYQHQNVIKKGKNLKI